MKKKLITIILSLVCVMTCVFAFTACSDDPKKMKSDVVTEEQWKEAFKAENFKNVKIESTATEEDTYMKADGSQEDYKVTVKSTIIIVDGVQYYKSEATVEKGSQEVKDSAENEMTFEKYSSVSDGKYTVYYKDKDGKWKQESGKGGVADHVIMYYVGLGTRYNEFEHQDGWVKGYWLKENTTGESARSYKFKNGKLAAVCTYEEGESTTLVYGNQKLTLPTPEASA